MKNNAVNFNIVNLENGVYIKASATVEAALVIPLYVYAVLAVMYMIQVFQVKSDINTAIYNTIREHNKYTYLNYIQNNSYETKSEITDSVSLYSMLIKNLGSDYAKKHNIAGGNLGIKVICRRESDSTKEVIINYSVKNPFDIFNIGYMNVSQKFISAAWLGEKYAKNTEGSNRDVVYITESGEVYHESRECRALDIQIKTADGVNIKNYRNAEGAIYYPCESCIKNHIGNYEDTVYITDYGNRYHCDNECSKLKRTVKEILRKNINGMRACKICGQ